MKNLILALSLFFALGASAQSKSNKTANPTPATTQTTDSRASIKDFAQKNLDQLIAFTPVNAETKEALRELFVSKYNLLKEIEGLPAERKNVVTQSMEYRLSLLLDPAAFERLKTNKELYNSLIN